MIVHRTTFATPIDSDVNEQLRGISVVDSWAHNPEVVGSIPTFRFHSEY